MIKAVESVDDHVPNVSLVVIIIINFILAVTIGSSSYS